MIFATWSKLCKDDTIFYRHNIAPDVINYDERYCFYSTSKSARYYRMSESDDDKIYNYEACKDLLFSLLRIRRKI